MIYVLLLLNSLFAQVSAGYNLYPEYKPQVVIENNSSTNGMASGYQSQKSEAERIVHAQEKYAQEFNQNYIQNETVKMKQAEVQAKNDLLKSAMLMDASTLKFETKNNSWSQFKLYVDTSDSLKEKYNNYSRFTQSSNHDYKKAVAEAESIIYSNISANFPKGYSASGIFVPESMDSKIPSSALANFVPSQKLNSPQGQIVRRVANEYQAFWGENSTFINRSYNDLSQFYLGASYVRLADEKFKSNPGQALAYLQVAKNILDFSEGVVAGTIDNATSVVKLIPELKDAFITYSKAVYKDPSYLVASTYSFIMSTPKLVAAVVNHLKDQVVMLRDGTPYEKGEVIGQYVLDILKFCATDGTANIADATVGTANVAKGVVKEFAHELASNPSLQNVVNHQLLPAITDAYEISKTLNNLSPKKVFKAQEMVYALRSSGKEQLSSQALDIAKKISEASDGSYETLYKISMSQMDQKNAAKYFNDVMDVEKIETAITKIDIGLKNITPEVYNGYIARAVPKRIQIGENVIINTQDSALSFHAGMKSSQNRYGIGGPEGISILSNGAGLTEMDAVDIARKEFNSYYKNMPETNLVMSTMKYQSSNVLVLNDSNIAKLGIDKKWIVDSRIEKTESYFYPNIVGDRAKALGYDSILAPSALDLTKMNLHRIKHE